MEQIEFLFVLSILELKIRLKFSSEGKHELDKIEWEQIDN